MSVFFFHDSKYRPRVPFLTILPYPVGSASSVAKQSGASLCLATELADPTGYGRIVRKGTRGAVLRIVEEKDAHSRVKLIKEVALSIYSLTPSIFNGLSIVYLIVTLRESTT